MTDYFPRNLPLESVPLTKTTVNTSMAETDNLSEKLAITIAEAGSERKAGEILLLKVADVSYLSDYFVMMTGYSRVQVRAIAAAIEEKVETNLQRRPLRTEGKAEGSWVLQDYGDVIVHIMMPKEREFYNLEAFWIHAERISLPNSDQVEDKPR
ncbi:MAG: ribosome silencing factor [Sphaerospermopsis kisseleviana]|jgi:ribosome-associated protein|uniref:Ribosomal silencing factor RsfS n=3 Tax=Sphaerospermopsis TaxID=752201 RepID=A0A480A0S9_9CYAN|nr:MULTISPECIES: ribosome silencing factor [Sphaerospermopsis]BAZ81292.1 iojap-like protein [Sphaerospermopsis kisseleviana NIES-73]MBD2135211.1 ribosome silencing factor [Sphaerospermopsis sp. FACHB-1094]MBD2147878.1 ribosome silencing factor [Sphaerospermopsis sp. FACHB-1194]MBE9238383.1 ribosome silencing factor [Sphaerospermopsis aphanizomenoides LEGE 00250]MDB9444368.1 ribosome silencing factor [Sphaerospermopsis kisseleviana CS-549]